MANQIDVVRFKEGGLCEIYQDVETKFAFITSPKEGNKQCHSLVKCRDFLHDAVSAFLHKGSVSIFGFRYEHGNNPPLDMNKMRMLVKSADNYSEEDFKNHNARAKKILVHYEKMAGFKTETTILKVKGEPKMRVYVSDGTWMKAPHLVSLYTLLIRLAVRKKYSFKDDDGLQKEFEAVIDGEKGNDVKYLETVRKKLADIMTGNDKLVKAEIIENYPKVDTDKLHNRGGIVSLVNGRHFDDRLKKDFKKL